MKIKLLDKSKDGNRLVMRITGTSSAYLNTLRRLLMNETLVMAIEDVEFRKNNSILYDEMLAHRLGLLPLTTEAKAGKDEKVVLTLKTGKTGKEPKMVYAKDIKSKDEKVKPAYPDMPLVKLHEDQEVEAEMTAVMGTGKEHSKWSPCLAWFKHYPHVKITKQPADAKQVAENHPQVFEIKGGKLSLKEEGLVNHDIIDSSIEKETDGAVKYEEKDDDFIFYIESWGQMDPKTLLEKAVEVYNEQLKDFKKLLK